MREDARDLRTSFIQRHGFRIRDPIRRVLLRHGISPLMRASLPSMMHLSSFTRSGPTLRKFRHALFDTNHGGVHAASAHNPLITRAPGLRDSGDFVVRSSRVENERRRSGYDPCDSRDPLSMGHGLKSLVKCGHQRKNRRVSRRRASQNHKAGAFRHRLENRGLSTLFETSK